MYHKKPRFSLVLCLLCLVSTNTMAAPSVRVLGANNLGIKSVPSNSESSNQVRSTTSAAKKSSVKATGMVRPQSTSSASNGNAVRIGSVNAGAAAAANTSASRLPIIAAKPKVAGAVNATNSNAAKFNEIDERMDGFQTALDGKANLTDLDNYYTKPEIDEMLEDYYTAEEVDGKLSDLTDLVSGNEESLTSLSERITANENGIAEINTELDAIGTQISSLNQDVGGNTANITLIQDQIESINERLADIDTISSVQEIRRLRERVHGYQVQLEEVLEASQTIYDVATESYKMVRIVDDFDTGILTAHTN